MRRPINNSTGAALVTISRVLVTASVIAALYFGREVLIPLALAALLAFVLFPLVTRIERWMGRIAAVLLVVALLFAMTGMAGWVLTRQLVDLGTKIPDYKVNIANKLRAFRVPNGGAFARLSQTLDDLKKDLPGSQDQTQTSLVATGVSTESKQVPAKASTIVPVNVIDPAKSGPAELAQMAVSLILSPLGKCALVLLLLIFMLLQLEDIRGRFIRLVGQGNISATTHAMDDAGSRVARYLLMQLLVNVTYGLCVTVGLTFIGVPNAMLWGVFATALRFIPYVGPWIGAAIPVALSLAVSPTWTTPLLTLGLFAGLELINANAIEPWLYGSSTGVSSMALVVGALVWTWLWGPVGLLLATPLTVCLAVIGRHVPSLEFLSIILSDERALATHEECYHRLLALDPNEPNDLIESYIKANSLVSFFDTVFIPIITMAEMDYRRESLDEDQRMSLLQNIRDIVEDLGARNNNTTTSPLAGPKTPVLCLPARAERDELAAIMLAHSLRLQGVVADTASTGLSNEEILNLVENSLPVIVCISVVTPSTIIQARYLSTKLRAHFKNLKIVVGLWGSTENLANAIERLHASGADHVVTSLAEAVVLLNGLPSLLENGKASTTIPAIATIA